MMQKRLVVIEIARDRVHHLAEERRARPPRAYDQSAYRLAARHHREVVQVFVVPETVVVRLLDDLLLHERVYVVGRRRGCAVVLIDAPNEALIHFDHFEVYQ